MRYSDNTLENEQEKVKNGERTIITHEMLEAWVGSDNPNGEAWETLLDILNDQYDPEDCVEDIIDFWEENGDPDFDPDEYQPVN